MADEPHRASRILLNLAAFVIIVAGIRAASGLLVPFLFSAFLAILFATPLGWLQRRRVPKPVAVVLIVLVILAIGTVIGGLVGTSLVDFTRAIPRYEARLRAQQGALVAWLQSLTWLQNMNVEISNELLLQYLDAGQLFGLFGTLITSLGQVLTNGALILITMVFILLEMSGFPAKILAAFGETEAGFARSNFAEMANSIRSYLGLKTLISLATGVGVTLWLTILGVDFPVLWGLLAFVLNFVPNIGSFIAAIPAVLLALIQFGPGRMLIVALGYLVVNIVMANLIEPRVMGRGVGLSTLVVFVSLVFWGWVLGPIGMLLSVPLTVMFRIALATDPGTRWVAVLLGSERGSEVGI
jgi:predicted PurR-regulated permease PerM